MNRWIWCSLPGLALVLALLAPTPAGAIPPYSRKYATSCGTCHTIYPKLTQFGEAFRRNGFRFPGAFDSDYIKQELIPLGQDAAKKDFPNSTWPSFMTSAPLLGFGVSGRMPIHPDTSSAAAIADNRTMVSFDRLASSGTLYATASIDDSLTVMAMVAVSDTGASLDETLVVWSDVVGPRHATNLSIGYAFPTLTPFARTSTYVGGRHTFNLAMTTLFGGTGAAFRIGSKYNLAELNGILGGRFEYGVGLAAGGHVDGPRPAENVYGHLAYKFGGMRLDGEGDSVATDPARPWTETAFTLYAYGYRSNTRFTPPSPPSPAKPPPVSDRATSVGGGARLTWGSAELNVGGLWEDHGSVTQVLDGDGLPGAATQVAASAELSYIIFPWLVPAVRVEHVIVTPRDLAAADDTRILPTIAMQLRPNVKLAFTGVFEHASGLPTGGGAWSRLSGDGIYLQPPDNTTPAGYELSVINVTASLGF